MILDKGICSIFRRTNVSEPGEMPRSEKSLLFQSWYGELAFETSTSKPTDGRKETRTDARIRILQCRAIKQDDLVILRDLEAFEAREGGDLVYKITRAYHGVDDESGELISDLTLEVDKP